MTLSVGGSAEFSVVLANVFDAMSVRARTSRKGGPTHQIPTLPSNMRKLILHNDRPHKVRECRARLLVELKLKCNAVLRTVLEIN